MDINNKKAATPTIIYKYSFLLFGEISNCNSEFK
jgi:hypothetical protein